MDAFVVNSPEIKTNPGKFNYLTINGGKCKNCNFSTKYHQTLKNRRKFIKKMCQVVYIKKIFIFDELSTKL